jgi:hypothetical protein
MKKTVKIKDFVSAVDYQIGEGYEYRWDCYGGDACGLDWTRNDLAASAAIIYDAKTHEVYEMSVWDCREEKARIYRWIKPEYIKAYKKESRERGFKFNVAIDKIKYDETTPAKLLGHLKRLYKNKALGKKPKRPKKVWID